MANLSSFKKQRKTLPFPFAAYLELSVKLQLVPMGSRLFGYSTSSSDWDYFTTAEGIETLDKVMEKGGSIGVTLSDFYSTYYLGSLNITVAKTEEAFKAMCDATQECLDYSISTRKEAVEVYRKHRLRYKVLLPSDSSQE